MFLFSAFVLFCCLCTAQVTNNPGSNPDTLEFHSDTIPFHYPYFGPRIPPFVGIVGGWEGYDVNCWEAGIIVHFTEYYSDRGLGTIIGPALTYKQSFSGRLKTVEAEFGVYSPFSIGFGFNENFYEGSRTFGFRPFIGTSWYHLQILAGYNFYSKKKSDIAELSNFTIKIRYVIPVTRIYKSVIPNPGSNY